MKLSSAKAKGMAFQRKIRDMILAKFEQLEPDDCVATSAGANGEDIRLSPAARRLIPWQVECKKNKAFSVYAAYDQCRGHGPHSPVVVIEADRRKPLAVIDFATFLELVEKASRAE